MDENYFFLHDYAKKSTKRVNFLKRQKNYYPSKRRQRAKKIFINLR